MNLSLRRPLPEGVGRVSQWFGSNPDAYKRFGLAGHNGLDYSVPAGTRVLAAHDGVLRIPPPDPAGYGIYCRVEGAQFVTLYAHLFGFIGRADGDRIDVGECIAVSGNSGNSTGPHLHFGLRVIGMKNQAYGGWIDPAPFRDV
jgi:murein DD-endopeptidase MepM/ murein hydrolase activator NlpD